MGCTGHDLRGKAHPGHHHKHLLFGAVINEHPTDVDRAIVPGQRNPGGLGRVIQPNTEVAGQQVGRTRGTRPSGVPEPARTCATWRTVPSPPQMSTTSEPAASAVLA